MKPVTIIGGYVSPYVRKVLVALHHKGVPYEIDPIIPFFGDDRFSQLSPLRRVPVLIDGDVVLSDSSVICQYLEDRHPEPALYPRDVAARAKARWLEEYADSRMGDVFIWQSSRGRQPFVWGVPPTRRARADALSTSRGPRTERSAGDGLPVRRLSIADLRRRVSRPRRALRAGCSRWPKATGGSTARCEFRRCGRSKTSCARRRRNTESVGEPGAPRAGGTIPAFRARGIVRAELARRSARDGRASPAAPGRGAPRWAFSGSNRCGDP
jgi:glutathione S-transferase